MSIYYSTHLRAVTCPGFGERVRGVHPRNGKSGGEGRRGVDLGYGSVTSAVQGPETLAISRDAFGVVHELLLYPGINKYIRV